MNTSLRRIAMMVMGLVVLLLINATITQVFRADALRVLDARRSLQSRTAEGAPSPRRMTARLAWWRKRLASAKP
jgi:argininosuccinate lyase